MEYRLKMVGRSHKRHVLLAANGLAQIPSNDHASFELVHVPRADHPLFEKGGNERNLVNDIRTHLLKVNEAAKSQVVVSAAKGDDPCGQHLDRVPIPAGERKRKPGEANRIL